MLVDLSFSSCESSKTTQWINPSLFLSVYSWTYKLASYPLCRWLPVRRELSSWLSMWKRWLPDMRLYFRCVNESLSSAACIGMYRESIKQSTNNQYHHRRHHCHRTRVIIIVIIRIADKEPEKYIFPYKYHHHHHHHHHHHYYHHVYKCPSPSPNSMFDHSFKQIIILVYKSLVKYNLLVYFENCERSE